MQCSLNFKCSVLLILCSLSRLRLPQRCLQAISWLWPSPMAQPSPMAPLHGPATWSSSMALLCGPATWSSSMAPLHGPDTWSSSMALLFGPATCPATCPATWSRSVFCVTPRPALTAATPEASVEGRSIVG